MTDQPSNIAREAKNIHQGVKELLKTRDPFDKELDFQRKNLRRRYLSLLLVHPYANESKDADTRLWMETSHAFISAYKQRISHLDRAIQKQQQQQDQQGPNTNPHNQRGHGPLEHRKLVQRFRQFLAEEEKFWTQFVVRFTRSFNLGEAQSALFDLGILSEEMPIKEIATGNPDDGEGGSGTVKLPHNGGRNHFQFPSVPEGSESLIPKTTAQRESRMEILSKALTCLGDIARYREQYNEAGGRPRAGYEDHSGPGRRGRFKKGGGGALIPELPRPRNYEKARHCYEQAKLLVPHEGNPSHQLAILASYQKDMFTSLVHYYRALCVRHPYDSASENIHTVLHKAIEQWKTKSRSVGEADLRNAVGKVKIEAFKEKLVVLHGLYRLGLGKYDTLTIKQAQGVCADLYSLVSERHLPEDFIIQVIVLSQAALWKQRMIRESSKANKNNNDRRSDTTAPGTIPSSVVEARLFTHLLSLHRALLEVGIEQLKEPAPIGPDGDLAQRIMVEFRRTLPALRIASKWLLANFKFVMQDPESLGTKNGKNRGHKRGLSKPNGLISPTSTETIEFWEKYSEFLRVLSRAFPINKLPDLTFALSEDTELRGFLPLKGTLDRKKGKERKEDNGSDVSAGADEVGNQDCPTEEKEVHPNDVQLMRIKDLLNDAKKIVDMQNSPLALYGNQFMLKGVEAQAQPVPLSDPLHLSDIEDDSDAILNAAADHDAVATAAGKADDDPVRDAFSHLDEEDEEDEIVWNPRASPIVSPKIAATPAVSRVSPAVQNLPSPGTVSLLPTNSPVVSASPVIQPPISPPVAPPMVHQSQTPLKDVSSISLTTAEDLLNGFMGTRLSPSARMPQQRFVSEPLAPTAPLLFGDRTGNSIWSTSHDEQASMRIAASSNQQQNFTHQSPISSHDAVRAKPPHSQWPPSPNAIGHAPRPFTPQHMPSGASPTTLLYSSTPHLGQHRRVPSSSTVAAQLFPDPVRHPGISDYGYAPPHSSLERQPIAMQQQLVEPNIFHQTFENVNQHSFGHASGRIYDSAMPNHSNYNDNIGFNNHHTRHLSLHDATMSAQSLAPTTMPPLWGGAG